MVARHVDGEDGRTALVTCAVDDHGDGGIVVFEAGQVGFPELARSGVAMVELVGEFKVELGYGWGEDGGAGAVANVHQLKKGRKCLLDYDLNECFESGRNMLYAAISIGGEEVMYRLQRFISNGSSRMAAGRRWMAVDSRALTAFRLFIRFPITDILADCA